LHAERAQLTRREVTTGKVEIARRTTERAETLHEELANERVEIKHVPIGRVIDRMPEIRQVGDTTIVPVVEEILVTEKRLVLKEEVHLQRVRTVRTHPETVMLREQQAVITRTATADDAPASVAVDTPDIFQTKDA
jgi:stress response protein YsnF